MKKIAFLYPGQGAQTTGMGKDFYDSSLVSRAVFEEGSEILRIDLASLCFTPNGLLDRTDYTQIAMVATCIAMTREIEKQGLKADITAGLSLGEYAAICTAGGMSYEDALHTVWYRGNLMQQAAEAGKGGMAAVLGLTGEAVSQVTDTIKGVSVANYNCPGQIVITGDKAALDTAAKELKNAGARRVLPLKVSGPFHSPYMKGAGESLRKKLEQASWKDLKIPYVTNVDAGLVTEIDKTPDLLERQVSSPVHWEQSVRRMMDWGVDYFLEIGPGHTLSGFLSRIDRSAKSYTINTVEDMHRVLEELHREIIV